MSESTKLPRATHVGELTIGGAKIACAVLDDGRRVLGQQAVFAAIGRTSRPKRPQAADDLHATRTLKTPTFLQAENLKPYILQGILPPTTNLIEYQTVSGRTAYGYQAGILSLTVQVYIGLAVAGKPTRDQRPIIAACMRLMPALVGIAEIALVDEATGYQAVREPGALQNFLSVFLRDKPGKYAPLFTREFAAGVCALRGYSFDPNNPYAGRALKHYQLELVYDRVPEQVIGEIKARVPAGDDDPKTYWHQLLNDDVGRPAVSRIIANAADMMHANLVCTCSWESFKRDYDFYYPKPGASRQLDFGRVYPDLFAAEAARSAA